MTGEGKEGGMKTERGLIHIYCGEGKGKTTAALGLALRAAGRGKRVVVARFLKNEDSGETAALKQVHGVRILPCGKCFGFTFQMDEEIRQEAKTYYREMFFQAVKEAENADLLILDEILYACGGGFVPKEELESFLGRKGKALEVVLTGRGPWERLLEMADYVTEMKRIRHPYQKGIPAREGIEY